MRTCCVCTGLVAVGGGPSRGAARWWAIAGKPKTGGVGRGGGATRWLLPRLWLGWDERLTLAAAFRQVRSELMGLPNGADDKVTATTPPPSSPVAAAVEVAAGVDGATPEGAAPQGSSIRRY